MYTYIHNSIYNYVELDEELSPEDNVIAYDWEGYVNGGWLLLSEGQLAFKEANPTASKQEVWNMELTPVPETPVRTLDTAKQEKVDQINLFDNNESGDGVNNFLVNNIPVWINAEKRSIYRSSVESAELLGEEVIELELAGMFIPLPVNEAKIMLARVQRYADKAAIVTAKHKQEVGTLETIEEVDNYDFITGYPEKESFTVTIP